MRGRPSRYRHPVSVAVGNVHTGQTDQPGFGLMMRRSRSDDRMADVRMPRKPMRFGGEIGFYAAGFGGIKNGGVNQMHVMDPLAKNRSHSSGHEVAAP